MRRWMYFAYGVGCHLLFLGIFVWMACFVGNLLVPKSIDTVAPGRMSIAILVDLGLLALFGVQHSVMARPAFKGVWTRFVPEPIERSTYVLLSCVLIAVLMWQWRGIDVVVWKAEHPALRGMLWTAFAAGWLLVPLASLLIHHFDLFGTRQVWLYLRGQEYQPLPFRVPSLYRHVRHPLYVGWFVAFWATPTMTLGHLVFAAVLTGYMAFAAVLEERDLIAHFGRQYAHYRSQVPMFIPTWKRAAVAPKEPASDAPVLRERTAATTHDVAI